MWRASVGLIIPKNHLFQLSSVNVQQWDCGEVTEANVFRGSNSLFKNWLHLLLGDVIFYSDNNNNNIIIIIIIIIY